MKKKRRESVEDVEDNSANDFYLSKKSLEMPEEGILMENGILFHHAAPYRVTEQHRDRLREYGIKLADYKRFTAEEDRQILKNWRRFARKHGFDYEDGRYYAGFQFSCDPNIRLQIKKEDKALQELGMWPAMCKKLENRSARQVRSRMILIMDPHYIGIPTPLTDDELILLYRRYAQGASMVDVAMELNKPLNRVYKALNNKRAEIARLGYTLAEVTENPELLKNRIVKKRERYRFFMTVVRKLKISVTHVRKLLLETRSRKAIDELMHGFNFVPLISSFGGFTEDNLRNTWNFLVDGLLENINQYQNSELDDLTIWKLASDKIIPFRARNLNEHILFLSCLRKCIDKETKILHMRYINQKKLEAKLRKLELIGDEDFNLNEHHSYASIKAFCQQRDKFLWNNFELQFTARDKLKILRMCYEKLEAQQDSNDATRFPIISQSIFVESTIEMVKAMDPNWVPPKILQYWVRSAHIVDMFDSQSADDGLSNPLKDIIALRYMTFEEEKRLLCLPQSGGLASGLTNIITKRVESRSTAQESGSGESVPRKRGWSYELNTAISLDTVHDTRDIQANTQTQSTAYMSQLTKKPVLEFVDSPPPQRKSLTPDLLDEQSAEETFENEKYNVGLINFSQARQKKEEEIPSVRGWDDLFS